MAEHVSLAVVETAMWRFCHVVHLGDHPVPRDAMIAAIEWLEDPSLPGRFAITTKHYRELQKNRWIFMMTDEDVAFAFKLRWG